MEGGSVESLLGQLLQLAKQQQETLEQINGRLESLEDQNEHLCDGMKDVQEKLHSGGNPRGTSREGCMPMGAPLALNGGGARRGSTSNGVIGGAAGYNNLRRGTYVDMITAGSGSARGMPRAGPTSRMPQMQTVSMVVEEEESMTGLPVSEGSFHDGVVTMAPPLSLPTLPDLPVIKEAPDVLNCDVDADGAERVDPAVSPAEKLRKGIGGVMKGKHITGDKHVNGTAGTGHMVTSEQSREDRLKDFLTQDKDLENMLAKIRKEEADLTRFSDSNTSWAQKNPWLALLTFKPDSAGKVMWDSMIVVLTLFSLLLVPVDIAFELSDVSPSMLVIMITMDVIFLIDIIVAFRTSYVMHNVVVYDAKLIAKHYLNSFFAVDAVSSIPFNIIFLSTTSVTWWLHLFTLFRLLRITKVHRAFNNHHQLQQLKLHVNTSVLQLASGLTMLLYVFHLLGCMYCVVVRHEVQEKIDDYLVRYPDAVAADARNSEENEWLPPVAFLNMHDSGMRPGFDLYFFAIWWAMCGMSGAQVSIPRSMGEAVFTFLTVFLGYLLNAYVIGLFTTALAQMSAAANMERQKRDNIEQYLRYKKIPSKLRKQIQQFYHFAGFDENESILQDLPITLRLQLDLVINRNLFLKVPFFKNCDMSQITVMVPRIHREYAWPGKTIMHEGGEGRGLFMIGRGFVRVEQQGTLQGLLTQGDFFGESSLLDEMGSPHTVTTITLCQFMVLDRASFEDVLELYPQMKKTLTKYSKMKQKSNSPGADSEQLINIKLALQNQRAVLSEEGRKQLVNEMQKLEEQVAAKGEGGEDGLTNSRVTFGAKCRITRTGGCSGAKQLASSCRIAPRMFSKGAFGRQMDP